MQKFVEGEVTCLAVAKDDLLFHTCRLYQMTVTCCRILNGALHTAHSGRLVDTFLNDIRFLVVLRTHNKFEDKSYSVAGL